MPDKTTTNPRPAQLCLCSERDIALAQRDAARGDLADSERRREALLQRLLDAEEDAAKLTAQLGAERRMHLREEETLRDKLQHLELVLAAGDRLAHVASGESVLYADLLNAVEAWKAVRR